MFFKLLFTVAGASAYNLIIDNEFTWKFSGSTVNIEFGKQPFGKAWISSADITKGAGKGIFFTSEGTTNADNCFVANV